MKKGGGSESTIIIGPSKSVLVYALHSLEYALDLARFRAFVPKKIIIRVGGDYRIRTNRELYELFNDIQRLRWLGHVVRMNEDGPPRVLMRWSAVICGKDERVRVGKRVR